MVSLKMGEEVRRIKREKESMNLKEVQRVLRATFQKPLKDGRKKTPSSFFFGMMKRVNLRTTSMIFSLIMSAFGS
ncbi:hypothetical protein QS257_06505 [Terrilactibacillus sp. S3-3]|nr:hypothetical protein QS257_06505 [Terrilactibacillus sp. S3-3]